MDHNFAEQINLKSDADLIDIYTNQSKFQAEFVELARKEIIKRNLPIDTLEDIREQKEAVEAETLIIGKQGNPLYLTLIALSAIGKGFPAIIGGYIYAYSTHTGANGEKYWVYNESTRKWGRIILFIGIAALLTALLIMLYR